MGTSDFIHLHVHSEYSLLDGYATTKAIAERAVELGMDSIAVTDHGVMYGALEFYNAAKKAGVKPIIGMEAYMAPGSHKDPVVKGGKNYYHLLLLAKNETGYRNLVKLTSRAHLDGLSSRGVFARPRIDRELLEQYREGIVVTSTCIAGEVIQHLTQQQKDKAREIAAWHRDLLGSDNYYIELQLHNNTPELIEINDELVRIANELSIPLVATNDSHFVRPEDLEAQKMVMAMGFNLTYQELCSKNYQMDETYHIASADDMWQRFKRYGTAPIENTRRIADMCNLKLDFGRVQLPELSIIPEGHDAASYLRLVCEEGLMRRFNGAPTEDYVRRLDYELDVINQTGFPDYMLIVWDYVKYARSRGIPCLPRGSAGASLVLYCLGITDVDPVQNKLLFERFLSPERLEMPDIDTDFADSRRHEILEYIASTYGRENVAQIITYGTLGAKAALRDIGRVLDVPLSEVDRIAKLIPALPVGTTIAQALERVPELKQIYDSNPTLKDVIDWGQKVEGRMKSVGTHACGVVVSRNPLEEIVPLQRTTKDENAVMAAYEGPTLAKMGLLKMDILGLTNLSIVAEALKYIKETTGQDMWLSDIPLDDKKTFESLGRGETTNVFQFESAGMTRYLKELKPTRVEDLYAMVALYRPGPLEQIPVYIRNKNNPRAIHYLHPILKPILEDTYGVIVYQEQIMHLLQTIAGYTLGEAYIVIKAISKKNKELMAENSARFKDGCLKQGISKEIADQLWELILPFAGYSFNRPHSTLYGLLSYQTAWLKVNYPTEYMAAVLTAAAGEIEEVAKSVTECGRLGVAVLPADVNQSSAGFTFEKLPDGQLTEYSNRLGIRFGLTAIRNVGSGPIEVIIAEREKNGLFKSLEEFCDRVDRGALNKRVLESLIKCGAMDSLPGSRRQKLAVLDQVLSAAVDAQKSRESGQASMFDLLGGGDSGPALSFSVAFPNVKETPADYKELLAWEKELLGMYISEHPIAQAMQNIPVDPNRLTLSQLTAEHIGQKVTLIGMLTGLRRVTTKKNDTMLIAQVEDIDGTIEMVAFPKVYDKFSAFWQEDNIVAITAKVEDRRETLQLVCESVSDYTEVVAAAPVEVNVGFSDFGDGMMYAGDDAPPPDDPAWTSLAVTDGELSMSAPSNGHSQAINGTNGHASNGHGHAHTQNGNGAMQQNESAPSGGQPNGAAQVTVVRPRQRIEIKRKEETPPSAQPASGPEYTLHIHLPRTENYIDDLRCMQEVARHLQQFRGDHRVRLYLPKDEVCVVLEPMERINPTQELLVRLAGLLGESSIQVEQAA
ncbi:MAG TPA: DNA polymerase III subunit alpha [Herpetosiphonaceae bacterium]